MFAYFFPANFSFRIYLYFQSSLKQMVDRWKSYCFYVIILLRFLVPDCSYVIFNGWLADSIPVTLLEDNCFFFLGRQVYLLIFLAVVSTLYNELFYFRKNKKIKWKCTLNGVLFNFIKPHFLHFPNLLTYFLFVKIFRYFFICFGFLIFFFET